MVMLIIQYNCKQKYESIVMVLEIALNIGARIVILKEPFIGIQELAHSAFNFYWPQGDRATMRVITAVRKDLLDKIVVEHRTDLINHPYFIFIKIWELDQQFKRQKRELKYLIHTTTEQNKDVPRLVIPRK